jgi:2-methylcitrate dehydratase PrpD
MPRDQGLIHYRHEESMTTLAEELAARIVATSFDQLTPQANRYAKMGLLDTIAVGIAGSVDEAAAIARRVAGTAGGTALVWGTDKRLGALDAAFVNGVAANVLDFDDCTDNLGGHPSSPILPALIGLAEERGAGGREVLAAYVAGFETETCLGRGVNFHHYEKGWHPTSTLGVFGAAAACAKLMELSELQTMHALALSASLAAGIKSNLGSMAKPMHIGHCSRSGLLAARLAAEGFTGNADAFEHHQGFLEVFNGAGNYDVGRILAKWGTPWEIEMPGIAVKQYPCCLSTQAVVDVMLRLVREHDIQTANVARVDARFSARRFEHTNRPAPRSALDAKLSVQYVLARALSNREVTLSHFEGDHYRDPAIRQAMTLMHVTPLDAQTQARKGDMFAEVKITLKDGGSFAGDIDRPVGHEAGVPLAPELLRAKFEACTQRYLGRRGMDDFYASVQAFEQIDDIRTLTDRMIPAARQPAAPMA